MKKISFLSLLLLIALLALSFAADDEDESLIDVPTGECTKNVFLSILVPRGSSCFTIDDVGMVDMMSIKPSETLGSLPDDKGIYFGRIDSHTVRAKMLIGSCSVETFGEEDSCFVAGSVGALSEFDTFAYVGSNEENNGIYCWYNSNLLSSYTVNVTISVIRFAGIPPFNFLASVPTLLIPSFGQWVVDSGMSSFSATIVLGLFGLFFAMFVLNLILGLVFTFVKRTCSLSTHLLHAFLGFTGIHCFLAKRWIAGVIRFFTLGGLGVLAFVDLWRLGKVTSTVSKTSAYSTGGFSQPTGPGPAPSFSRGGGFSRGGPPGGGFSRGGPPSRGRPY